MFHLNLLPGLTGICQLLITAFRGDNVLLPCIYSKVEELPEKLTVFWLNPDDMVVVKIREDFISNPFATSFPQERKKGNFSILVKNVQPSHSGVYICNIPSVYYSRKVKLNVSGSC